jgi:hypothetical protein
MAKLQPNTKVILKIDEETNKNKPTPPFESRNEQLHEILTGNPTSVSYRIPTGEIISYEHGDGMYLVMWENAFGATRC